MDMLNYEYDPGNKLTKVSDVSSIEYGFKDGTNTNDDFEYDDNGNMIIDRNKGIASITYNHLNLPTNVVMTDGNIQYIYDTAGIKIKKIVNNTSESSLTTTEYAGNYIYENNVLQFFRHTEGYVSVENGSYKYVYEYKDHLGNMRLSYTDADGNGSIATNEIVKESNYYPFGLKHKGYNNQINGVENNYMTYNGKELEESLGLNWLHYGDRNYMPDIGRWGSIDQLSEIMPDQGTFNHAFNSPLYYTDTDGNAPKGLNNPIVIFRRSENKVYIYEDNDTPFDFTDDILLGTYNAHNLVISTSNGIWSDGVFTMYDRFKPHKHPGKYNKNPLRRKSSMYSFVIPKDSRNGPYGEHGIYRANPFRDKNGVLREGMGFHAGREYKGLFRRKTNGCIRCEPDFFTGIANAIEVFGPWNISIVETETGSQTNNSKVNVTPQPITPAPDILPSADIPDIQPINPNPPVDPNRPVFIPPPPRPDNGF